MLHKQVGLAELRALEPWQATEFAAYVDQERDHLSPWLPWATTIRGEQTAREFLQRYADRAARDEGRIYGLWFEDELVGGVLFRTFDPQQKTCEIGVWLSADAQGHGIVTSAVREMIAWAFDVRGMRRIEWHCVSENERSIATATRLGFTREGVLRQSFDHHGTVHDVEVWALLAEERGSVPQEAGDSSDKRPGTLRTETRFLIDRWMAEARAGRRPISRG